MKPVLVLGGGGHARVLVEMLQIQSRIIIGYTDPVNHSDIWGIPWIGDDTIINKYIPEDVELVNAVGSVGDNTIRKEVFRFWKGQGFSFLSVIHSSAIVSEHAILEEGVQIMAGAVIQAGAHIGNNSIINTRATVDHDTIIGRHVHIAPGAVLSGRVLVEDDAHVGTGAIVIQGITIGRKSIVGAGAVVIKNVPEEVKVAGVPARLI